MSRGINKLDQLWTEVRASLWFVPGIMIIVSIALALALIEVDSVTKTDWLTSYPRLFGLGADGARGMLTAIASSMLTVAALAFSLTLNAVMQASGQFTPRILRNFMSDRANQFVLGYFVSVFAFCLLVLRTIRGADEIKFVPSFAVMTALLLALGGILVLIFFIHHIAASLQITTILDNITVETKKAVEHLFPEEVGEAADPDEKATTWDTSSVKNWKTMPNETAGYIQDVDTDGLLEFASTNKLLIEVRRSIGQFVHRGQTLAMISPIAEQPMPEREVNEAIASINELFTVGGNRTIEKDVGFGVRQIVDIALKALSPGVNDTTTAINCIDNLGDIVGEIARRRMPAKVRSKDNVALVAVAAPGFDSYVETAFDQIRISGKANQAVFERLLSTLTFIAESTSVAKSRRILEQQIELVGDYAEQTLETEYERVKIRHQLTEARNAITVLGTQSGGEPQ